MKILVSERVSAHRFKTPEGYLVCQDAILARTGKQTYLVREIFPQEHSDDTIEIDRTEDEVFDESTMASFENKPVTVEHPEENVNPENFKRLAVGFVRDVRRSKADGVDVLIGNIIITDAKVIEDIERGIRTELSCGYDCDITRDEHPRQIHIRGNHVALCEQGRAGNARLIDSAAVIKQNNKWVKPVETKDATYCDELNDFAAVINNSKDVRALKKIRNKLFDVMLTDIDKKNQKRALIDAINDKIISLAHEIHDSDEYSAEHHRNVLVELGNQLTKLEDELFKIDDESENDAVKERIRIIKEQMDTIKKQMEEHRKALGL